MEEAPENALKRSHLDLTAGSGGAPHGQQPAAAVIEIGDRVRAAFAAACEKHDIRARMTGESPFLRFEFDAQEGADADWVAGAFFSELDTRGVRAEPRVALPSHLADHLDELEAAFQYACRRLQSLLVDRNAFVSGGLPFVFPGNDPTFSDRGLAVNRYPASAQVKVDPTANQVAIRFAPQSLGKITSVGFFVPTLLRGDFTATARYHLGEFETGSEVACFALYAMDELQTTCFYVQRMIVSGEPHRVAGHMAGELQAQVPVSGTSGEWRVMRRGELLTTSHRIDGEWVQVGEYREPEPRDMIIGAKLWSIVDCGRMEAFVTDLVITGELSEEQMTIPAVAIDPVASTADWMTRAREVLAYGGLSSPVEGVLQYEGGTLPQFAERAQGCRLIDSTGRTYVDWINGRGPVVLGHRRPEIETAIRQQLEAGPMLSLIHRLEVEVAEILREMIPCAERVAFGKNGSDVTTAAIRVARAATGRQRILQCGFHGFHGWYIGLLGCPGIPAPVFETTHPFPYDDPAALEELLDRFAGEVAAVILEPTSIALPSEGYLDRDHRLAQRRPRCPAPGTVHPRSPFTP